MHELTLGQYSLSAKLVAHDGTTINFRSAVLIVTNQHIYINSQPSTYTVVGKGDRTVNGCKIPILNCQPHRFIQPWFGPYKWESQITKQIDGIEPGNALWQLKLTFNEGGAFEFRQKFLDAFGKAYQAQQEGIDEVLPAYTES